MKQYLAGVPSSNEKRKATWIAHQVDGSQILDVGNNLGLHSFLLGKRGKRVLVIDPSSYPALSSLTHESVEFIQTDFLEFDGSPAGFDTVILSETIGTLNEYEGILPKVYQLLQPYGKFILSVPFPYEPEQAMDSFVGLMKQIYPYVTVHEVNFTDNWVSLSGQRNEDLRALDSFTIDAGIVKEAKSVFEAQVRRDSLLVQVQKAESEEHEKLKTLRLENLQLKEKLEDLHSRSNANLTSLTNELTEELSGLQFELQAQTERNNVLQTQMEKALTQKQNEIQQLKEMIENERQERRSDLNHVDRPQDKSESLTADRNNDRQSSEEREFIEKHDAFEKTLKEELLNELNHKEDLVHNLIAAASTIEKLISEQERYLSQISTLKDELLNELSDKETLIKECIAIQRKLNDLNHKYNSLRNSKMGKLTVKYWEVRKKAVKKGK